MMTSEDKAQREKAFAAVRAAIAKVNAGKPQDEVCAFCQKPLVVEGLPPGGPFTQWQVHCPCGKSNGIIKGL
jgi:hypothetical protein